MDGYAITDAYADQDDARLKRGQAIRLVRWTN
jgi:hypothetical protein